MPRDSSGNYTLPVTGNPVLTATTISSSWANTTLNDLAAEMTDSLDRSGKGGMLAAFKFSDGALGAPGMSWTNEPTSGMYRSGAGVHNYVILGTTMLTINSNGITSSALNVGSGAGVIPSYGVYAGTNSLAFAANGVNAGYINNQGGWTHPASSTAGQVTITVTAPTAAQGIIVNQSSAGSSFPPLLAQGSTVAGSSFGIGINAGRNGSDQPFYVNNYNNTIQFLALNGLGSLQLNPQTSGNNGFTISSPTGGSAGADLVITRTTSTANTEGAGSNLYLSDSGAATATQFQHSGGQTELWQLNSASWFKMWITTAIHQFLVNGGAATPSVSVTFNATQTIDASKSNVFRLTLTNSITTFTISNPSDGQTINIFMTQDGTGSRTVSWPSGANYKWANATAGVLSTAPNSVDIFIATYRADTSLWYCTLTKGFG